jgi:hypothetical protein
MTGAVFDAGSPLRIENEAWFLPFLYEGFESAPAAAVEAPFSYLTAEL